MSFSKRDFLSIDDVSRKDMDSIFRIARRFESVARAKDKTRVLEGKILANLFFEPSTRTRMSFESAIQRLGGGFIDLGMVEATSLAKGETFEDTIRVIDNYVDLLVIRHSQEGKPKQAAAIASAPVINAGDGTNEHPTQAVLDLYTIFREKGKIDGLNVTFLGDCKHARSFKSLALGLTRFNNVRVKFVSPPGLEMHQGIINELQRRGLEVEQSSDVRSAVADADVLRVVRVMKERFSDQDEYERLRSSYVVDLKLLTHCKKDMIILHGLPRIDELATEVDSTPHAVYFKQVFYGLCTRMALLYMILKRR
ncbi:MAG: aspartate carbamoyltransferase [Candidatus Bathyarchaeia archaeon]